MKRHHETDQAPADQSINSPESMVLSALELARAAAEQGRTVVLVLRRFRIFERQPEWHERSPAAQLRRWSGTTARRKQSYARWLVNALDLNRVPEPLVRLLGHVGGG